MDIVERPKSALCRFDLLSHLLDPNEPKTEREYVAVREIARLRAMLDTIERLRADLALAQGQRDASEREVERLQGMVDLELVKSQHRDLTSLRAENASLRDENAGLRADAVRYRWLRTKGPLAASWLAMTPNSDRWDESFDAAMQKGE